jgi:biopolymer transport protein ExbB
MTNLITLFVQGGILMYPLLLTSIVTLVLISERCAFWWKIYRRQEELVQKVLILYKEDIKQAIAKLEENIDLPIARIFLSAIHLESPNIDEFNLALEGAVHSEIPVLKRFQNILDTIITLSPLMGLLGTVTGLMTSFANIRVGEITGEKASAVSGGISEALITTATGLIIAITATIFANIFRSLYQRQMAFIQEYATQLELYFRRYYANS